MKYFSSVLVLAGLVAIAGATSADAKSFHGAICTAHDPVAPGDPSIFPGNYGISVIADGTETLWVTCPLIRDRVGSDTNIDQVAIEGHNDSAPGITCILSSQEEDDSGFQFAFHQISTTTVGDFHINGFVVDTTDGAEGSYVMECEMQDNDYLYHIYLDEEDSAD